MIKKKKKKRPILLILGILVVVLIIIAVVFKKKSGDIEVQTEKPAKRSIVEMVSASGKIFPEVEVAIIPELPGEVKKLYVDEGDSVSKGDMLAKINPDIYQDALQRTEAVVFTAKANLGNAKARASQAKAQFEKIKLDYERNKKLYAENVISSTEMETSETAYNVAIAEINAAEESVNAARYGVKSAEASYEESKNNLEKTNIFAPMSGIVTALNVEEGKVVGGISTFSATEMMKISDLSKMETRVDVSENDILRIHNGDTVLIDVEAYTDREFKGVVTQISSSANSQLQLSSEQATNFTVKIYILKSSYDDLVKDKKVKHPFLPGMSASVEIITNWKDSVLCLPIEAVTTRLPKEINDSLKSNNEELKECVFLLTGETVTPMLIKTGIQDDQYIEIVEGLEGDEEVVTGPYSTLHRLLKKGDKVEVNNSKKKKKG
jgi:HlyD family secretion protein